MWIGGSGGGQDDVGASSAAGTVMRGTMGGAGSQARSPPSFIVESAVRRLACSAPMAFWRSVWV